MKQYYYVNTFLTANEWEEMIISKDDPEVSISPRILIWPEGGLSNVEENPMYQVLYRKYFGGWEKVHYSYTYLTDNLIVSMVELDKIDVESTLPPSFVWKDMK